MITVVQSERTFLLLHFCLNTPYPWSKLEGQNIEFREVIKFLTKKGAYAKEIHRRMAGVYGDNSPKYSTVVK